MGKQNNLTKAEILHLAQLAQLTLSEEEVIKFQKQLTETLDYIKNLDELETTNIAPTSHSLNLVNVTFTDGQENKRGLLPEESLKNIPNKKNNFFVVKKIL